MLSERLHCTSLDSLGISLLREPDTGPNYEKLMRLYSNFRDSHILVDIVFVEDIELLKWAVCGLNYQAQFILINQIQVVLGNRVQLGL